jgi:hypothetical protein
VHFWIWSAKPFPKKFLANWLGLTGHVIKWGNFSGEIDWIWSAKPFPKKFLANWLGLTGHVIKWGNFSGEIDWIWAAKPLPKNSWWASKINWASGKKN